MKHFRALAASLRALAVAALASVTAGTVHAQQPADPETAAWIRARNDDTVEAYQRYLETYPLGAHSAEAFQAMVELMLVIEGSAPPDEALPGVDMY
jgi:hypothetical protein